MASKSKVLELINRIKLDEFSTSNFESKHLLAPKEQEKSGHISVSGQTRAESDEGVQSIFLYTNVVMNALEDDKEDPTYRFLANYECRFSFNDRPLSDLEKEGLEASDLIPIMNSIAWPLIRRHLMGSLENAGFGAIHMPFTPPVDLFKDAG